MASASRAFLSAKLPKPIAAHVPNLSTSVPPRPSSRGSTTLGILHGGPERRRHGTRTRSSSSPRAFVRALMASEVELPFKATELPTHGWAPSCRPRAFTRGRDGLRLAALAELQQRPHIEDEYPLRHCRALPRAHPATGVAPASRPMAFMARLRISGWAFSSSTAAFSLVADRRIGRRQSRQGIECPFTNEGRSNRARQGSSGDLPRLCSERPGGDLDGR